ncbi:MAG: DegV family protein [Anaeromicrobium sp.]|jgi:DegV family protein with EDD domain|uniref:DegV family protein n=1 Tax=Anaeromicrobium sp. TaxID=1929132 RepID=UPI0025FC995C|nr:DegV family protein [Anaeromicrobium sp.]MCT4595921.1 DegV family protein [Anaeromicrobium sp.]
MSIKLIIDSTCDLPEEIIKKYDLDMLPLRVYIDGKEYLDKVNITLEELYELMRAGHHPKTSQVNPSNMKEVFEKHAKEGNECIYLTISSELSGTYQTALLVAKDLKEEYPDFKLKIVDSKAGSTGIGLMAYETLKQIDDKRDFHEIVESLEFQTNNIEHIFTVDSLSALYRCGRLSKSAALLGDMFKIKVILSLKEGAVEPLDKVRGNKKALKTMVDIVEERIGDFKDQLIGISHAEDLEGALKLKEMLTERLGIKDYMINLIGSSFGSNLGIGTRGIFFLNKKPKDYIPLV